VLQIVGGNAIGRFAVVGNSDFGLVVLPWCRLVWLELSMTMLFWPGF
jgi:hypothetical protein